ncbi:catalase-like [Agrilus planipennis]|uniref:Catalase-like n=1 Tax=Agrilus planipennis TaxID=224129 RepID=A0A7F5RB05_AGRPL|nr:catalase-like [Agrilus planipennis]XP_025833162.1 catalase-like [Agrilus planipennis]
MEVFKTIFLLYFLILEKVIPQTCPSSSTTSYGSPLIHDDHTATVGSNGPVVLEDTEFLDEMSHFDRERIPPRVVHAKGFGASGYFEVTNDITKYSAAKVFSQIGKKTPIAVRLSSTLSDQGIADTIRDVRGFSVKFYTEDGIWDLVGNDFPVFFIRDPRLFPHVIHALKRHPTTNLFNATTRWDFYTLRPETAHIVMWLYSDMGTPYSMRHINGYGVNTFKLVNKSGQHVYCKFHLYSRQGIKNYSGKEAAAIQASDLDIYQRDMFNNIAKGNYPSWTMHIQVMTQNQADTSTFNIFDDTKVWPEDQYPLIEVGRLTLTKNPINYFEEVEQIAFCPTRMVPGIRPSVDRMLHGRLYSYTDTQLYRLGANYMQLPINRPCNVQNYQRDGKMTFYSQGGAVNYHPNSFGGPNASHWAQSLSSPYFTSGVVGVYDNGDEDNFSQATYFYKHRLDDAGRNNFIENVFDELRNAERFIQKKAIKMFKKIDESLAQNLATKLNSAK